MSDLNAWVTRCDKLRLELEDQIVDLLDRTPAFRSESSRRQLVTRTERHAAVPLQVPENPLRRQWFHGFIEECSRCPRGLAALRDGVRALADTSKLTARVTHLVECWDTADTAATAFVLWPTKAGDTQPVNVWDVLHDALQPWPANDVKVEFQLATGDREAAPPWHCATGWQVFVHLVNRTTSRGLPAPYLIFLDQLIHNNRLDRTLEPLAEAWVRQVATEHGCLAELDGLRRRRADPLDGRSPVHMVLRLEGAGPARDQFDLTWRLERYRPGQIVDAGEQRERLPRDQLERAVSGAVRKAERILSHTADELSLEFVLPFDLLDAEVEWWRKEDRFGPPRPLVLDYSVTLRSLERVESPELHRVLRERWRYVDQPADSATYWCAAHPHAGALSLEAALRADKRLIALVLSGPPHSGSRAMGELLAGLRTGIAGILWRRTHGLDKADPDESLRAALAHQRAADLPRATRHLRLDAQLLPPEEQLLHLGRQVALLWDDPHRIADVPGENGL
ncbi:hypothetical protein E0504_33670 [Parafrankia sp. BMG5.11]|nr:hypothetical protein E0504_33670 [Parafrankia sp. BMG5.11]